MGIFPNHLCINAFSHTDLNQEVLSFKVVMFQMYQKSVITIKKAETGNREEKLYLESNCRNYLYRQFNLSIFCYLIKFLVLESLIFFLLYPEYHTFPKTLIGEFYEPRGGSVIAKWEIGLLPLYKILTLLLRYVNSKFVFAISIGLMPKC